MAERREPAADVGGILIIEGGVPRAVSVNVT